MITQTVTLPAYWASALINNDMSGLSNTEYQLLDRWLTANPEYGDCLSCSDESFTQRYDGLLTDCLEYVFPLAKVTTCTKKFNVYLQSTEPGRGSYLEHRGRTAWGLRTAKKHKRDVTREIVNGTGKYSHVQYVTLVPACEK